MQHRIQLKALQLSLLTAHILNTHIYPLLAAAAAAAGQQMLHRITHCCTGASQQALVLCTQLSAQFIIDQVLWA